MDCGRLEGVVPGQRAGSLERAGSLTWRFGADVAWERTINPYFVTHRRRRSYKARWGGDGALGEGGPHSCE